MIQADPNYVFHDDFAEENAPVYFAAFVQHAQSHGLCFFAEALFSFFEDPRTSPETQALLQQVAGHDMLALEQYLDFVRCRAFRQSLLCHRELTLPMAFEIERLFRLHASSPLKPHREANAEPPSRFTFRSPDGAELRTQQPLVKAALELLARAWPGSVPLEELLVYSEASGAAALTPADPAERRAFFARVLLGAAALRVVERRVRAVPLATRVSERPRVSRLARLEAEDGTTVTTLRHSRVRLEDEASRHLLCLLDGTRTRAELLQRMRDYIAQRPRAPESAPGALPPLHPEELEQILERIAELGLLCA